MNLPELKKTYADVIVPSMMKSRGYKNVHQVPKVEKVVINSSFGAEMDKNGLEDLKNDIASLAGQSPVVVRAKVRMGALPSAERSRLVARICSRDTRLGRTSALLAR